MTATIETGTWGLYPWFVDDGVDCVHPEDLEEFLSLMAYGKVFRVAGVERDMITLEYGTDRFRVKPHLFTPVDRPAKSFGEEVTVTTGGKTRRGRIVGINWHYKKARPFFILQFGARRSSRQYWPEEFC